MIRLLKIELQKLRPYKPFWILGGLYLLLMVGLSLSSHAILDWWSGLLGNGIQGILPIEMPIFDFVDIWQNLTWVGRFYLPVLGFLIVISVYNEINHNTLKQNIIDGMSRNEWVISKILLLLFISLVAGVAVLFSGLYMGSLHSSVTSYEYIVKNIAFVP
ncbi:MAG: ABC transporter permease, partial [Bacteroidetes bacterium]|nr:ABC transporter permease [Bacteroidota bacterium]